LQFFYKIKVFLSASVIAKIMLEIFKNNYLYHLNKKRALSKKLERALKTQIV